MEKPEFPSFFENRWSASILAMSRGLRIKYIEKIGKMKEIILSIPRRFSDE